MAKPTSIRELRDSGYTSRSVKQELRDNLIARLRKGEGLFSGIVGYEQTVVPQIENAVLSGQDIVFLGERGQAKTRMARLLVGLLDEEMPALAGCEISDDPFAPICTACRQRVAESTRTEPSTETPPPSRSRSHAHPPARGRRRHSGPTWRRSPRPIRRRARASTASCRRRDRPDELRTVQRRRQHHPATRGHFQQGPMQVARFALPPPTGIWATGLRLLLRPGVRPGFHPGPQRDHRGARDARNGGGPDASVERRQHKCKGRPPRALSAGRQRRVPGQHRRRPASAGFYAPALQCSPTRRRTLGGFTTETYGFTPLLERRH